MEAVEAVVFLMIKTVLLYDSLERCLCREILEVFVSGIFKV